MKISNNTIKALDKKGYMISFYNQNNIETTKGRATKIIVNGFDANNQYACKVISVPKNKEISIDWIMNRLFKKSINTNIATYLKPIFGMSATSYGVSIDALYHLEKSKKEVRSKLNNLGLEYKEEYSFNHFSYCFKISKNKKNMSILEHLN